MGAFDACGQFHNPKLLFLDGRPGRQAGGR